MKPLMVEVIAYAPTQFYHCAHCEVVWNELEAPSVKKWHDETLESSMPADMMQDYKSLSDWILNSVERYGGRVVFKVIDAASVEGFIKSIRYRVRQYPAVIVEGGEKLIGTDFAKAESLIDRQLAHQPA